MKHRSTAMAKSPILVFLCTSVHVVCFVCAFGWQGLIHRAFDPCYFQLQTIDFNYQTPSFSATAPSPASVPRSADEVRVINGNVAAGVCHFQSVLPITADEIWWLLSIRLSPVEGWRCYTTNREPFSLGLWREPEEKSWCGRNASVPNLMQVFFLFSFFFFTNQLECSHNKLCISNAVDTYEKGTCFLFGIV